MEQPLSYVLCAVAVCACSAATGGYAQEPEVTFRVDVVGGNGGPTIGGVTAWTLEATRPASGFVDVEAEITLVSRVEPCVSDPSLCQGDERFLIDDGRGCYVGSGCSDGLEKANKVPRVVSGRRSTTGSYFRRSANSRS